LNRKFWRHLEAKTRAHDKRREEQRLKATLPSIELPRPLLVVLRNDLKKLPAGIAIQFPHEVAINLIHQRYATPVASFAAEPDLVIDEPDLQYTDLPSTVIPLGTALDAELAAA
jgi:hypothetical protein